MCVCVFMCVCYFLCVIFCVVSCICYVFSRCLYIVFKKLTYCLSDRKLNILLDNSNEKVLHSYLTTNRKAGKFVKDFHLAVCKKITNLNSRQ